MAARRKPSGHQAHTQDASTAGLPGSFSRPVKVTMLGADTILTWPERRALSILPSLRSLEANLADQPWAIILIGRDGGVKARWDQPVPMSDLTRLIDAMPMGRREKAARDAAGADHL